MKNVLHHVYPIVSSGSRPGTNAYETESDIFFNWCGVYEMIMIWLAKSFNRICKTLRILVRIFLMEKMAHKQTSFVIFHQTAKYRHDVRSRQQRPKLQGATSAHGVTWKLWPIFFKFVIPHLSKSSSPEAILVPFRFAIFLKSLSLMLFHLRKLSAFILYNAERRTVATSNNKVCDQLLTTFWHPSDHHLNRTYLFQHCSFT